MPALNNTQGTLTKACFAEAIWNQTNIPKARSAELVDTVFEIIKQTLENGEHVMISGFGKFSVREKAERRGRKPQTGEAMLLVPRKVVTFKSAGILRDKINGKGNKAKQFTSEMVFSKVVEVEPVDVDRYGRTVGIVKIEDVILNEELVREGFAWVYPEYCHRPICGKWYVLSVKAHDAEKGHWRDPKPIPPWEFRRQKRGQLFVLV